MTALNKSFDWDELVLFIKERQVIPIVGQELTLVPGEHGLIRVDRLVARKLAERLGVETGGRFPDPTLDDVAGGFIREGGNPRRVYFGIKAVMDGPEIRDAPLPQPLRMLAEITDFQLFVSTTLDSFLAKALDQTRYGGTQTTRKLAYSTKGRVRDLPGEIEELAVPHVYDIFGSLVSSPDFAVTDRDVLETLHRLQGPLRRPQILFDEMRAHHLLFIGCDFPNWLSRFFVRTMMNQSIRDHRDTAEVVADSESVQESSLRLFYRDCWIETFPSGGPVEFVQELHSQWSARKHEPKVISPRPAVPQGPVAVVRPAPSAEGDPDMVEGAVFLSYAKEDRQTVVSLWQALDAGYVDAWFDRRELPPGTDWKARIEANILRCCLFVPIVSKNAQARLEGFFRQEWAWALERTGRMAEELPFIVPVVLDVEPGAHSIPDAFWAKQAITLDGGEASEHVVRQVRTLVQKHRAMQKGLL